MRREVEDDVGELDLVDDNVATTARERTNPGEKLGRLEGLGHVVVCAGVEALDLVGRRGAGREEQNRRGVALLAELMDDLEAGDAGQHHVEDDCVIKPALRAREPRMPVIDGLGVVVTVLHDAHDRVRKVALVLDHQYVHDETPLPESFSGFMIPKNPKSHR